jgi:hypothetical protein
MTLIFAQFDLGHGRIRKPGFFETQRGRIESSFRWTNTTADPRLSTAIVDRLQFKRQLVGERTDGVSKYFLPFGGSAATWHRAPGRWPVGPSW